MLWPSPQSIGLENSRALKFHLVPRLSRCRRPGNKRAWERAWCGRATREVVDWNWNIKAWFVLLHLWNSQQDSLHIRLTSGSHPKLVPSALGTRFVHIREFDPTEEAFGKEIGTDVLSCLLPLVQRGAILPHKVTIIQPNPTKFTYEEGFALNPTRQQTALHPPSPFLTTPHWGSHASVNHTHTDAIQWKRVWSVLRVSLLQDQVVKLLLEFFPECLTSRRQHSLVGFELKDVLLRNPAVFIWWADLNLGTNETTFG